MKNRFKNTLPRALGLALVAQLMTPPAGAQGFFKKQAAATPAANPVAVVEPAPAVAPPTAAVVSAPASAPTASKKTASSKPKAVDAARVAKPAPQKPVPVPVVAPVAVVASQASIEHLNGLAAILRIPKTALTAPGAQ